MKYEVHVRRRTFASAALGANSPGTHRDEWFKPVIDAPDAFTAIEQAKSLYFVEGRVLVSVHNTLTLPADDPREPVIMVERAPPPAPVTSADAAVMAAIGLPPQAAAEIAARGFQGFKPVPASALPIEADKPPEPTVPLMSEEDALRPTAAQLAARAAARNQPRVVSQPAGDVSNIAEDRADTAQHQPEVEKAVKRNKGGRPKGSKNRANRPEASGGIADTLAKITGTD